MSSTRPSADDGCDLFPDPEANGNRTQENIELLDTLSVEKECVSTVNLIAYSMLYRHPVAVSPDGVILLNMVDIPIHANFRSWLKWSLTSDQEASPLFNVTQFIQAHIIIRQG